ncbi:hypothetical protein V8E36_002340 [Tilletia maclaganii]
MAKPGKAQRLSKNPSTRAPKVASFGRTKNGGIGRTKVTKGRRAKCAQSTEAANSEAQVGRYDAMDLGLDFGGDAGGSWDDVNVGTGGCDGRNTAVEVVDLRYWKKQRARYFWDIEERAFEEWSSKIDALVDPFVSATRDTIPCPGSGAILSCACEKERPTAGDKKRTLIAIDFEDIKHISVKSCDEHRVSVLIGSGLVPATVTNPVTAFSLSVLRFFRALQDQTRMGASHFMNALMSLYQEGTTKMKPRPAIPSKNRYRKQLRAALDVFSRPVLDDDDLGLSLTDLATSFPACFGNLVGKHEQARAGEATDGEGAATDGTTAAEASAADASRIDEETIKEETNTPEVIVCLDGNFQHKRLREEDAVARSHLPPRFFLSTRQMRQAQDIFETSTQEVGPATGCGAYVIAAVEGERKTSLGPFDVGGVVGMTCRHGSPLVMVDVVDTGEAHHYAYGLLHALLAACGDAVQTLGVCYDIGCKLAVSPRMQASLS